MIARPETMRAIPDVELAKLIDRLIAMLSSQSNRAEMLRHNSQIALKQADAELSRRIAERRK